MDNERRSARNAGRSYMMRSEKRPGYNRHPARRRKPKKRWLYKLLTLLLLLLCCPVGLILLWRRRPIRWNGFKKLLVSIVSLILCFVLLSVSLLYDFGNPAVKKVQDGALHLLDETRELVQMTGEKLGEGRRYAQENWYAFVDYAPQIMVVAGNQALHGVQSIIATPSPVPTDTPVPTATPEPTKTPRQKYVRESEGYAANRLKYLTDMALTGTSELTQDDLQPTNTPEAVAGIHTAGDSRTPPPEQAVTDPPTVITRAPTNAPTDTPTPVPTPGVTIEPMELTYAHTSTVYYTTTGTYYHKGRECGTMTQAREHTVSEALKAGKKQCPYCGPVPERYAQENAWLVWLDEGSRWHLGDTCSAVMGQTQMLLFDELAEQPGKLVSCTVCGANQYEEGLPQEVRDRKLDSSLVTNGDQLVYFSEQGRYYHVASKCESTVQMTYIAHTLFEAVSEDKEPCPHCQPPAPAFD